MNHLNTNQKKNTTIAVYNLGWQLEEREVTDEDSWCLLEDNDNAFGLLNLLTAPDTFHNTIKYLMRLPNEYRS